VYVHTQISVHFARLNLNTVRQSTRSFFYFINYLNTGSRCTVFQNLLHENHNKLQPPTIRHTFSTTYITRTTTLYTLMLTYH